MQPLRVLQVFGEPLANGGQESYIMNMYRHIDRQRVQFDFFTPFTVDNRELREEIEELGGQVHCAGFPFGEDKNRCFAIGVSSFLPQHPHRVVHIHSGSTYALMTGARLARKCGTPHVIVHSHCGGFADLRYRFIRLLSRQPLLTYPTAHFACSHLAARWKYPTPLIREGRYTVLHNAVDTERFYFDPTLRQEMRQQLGLESNLVVGHVGRFATQKNHRFLLDIFAALVQQRPDARLLLVGEGELLEEIQEKAARLELSGQVRFLGIQQDIPALMNAFDVLVLPSFFEGLPVVGVEAQATGLPVVTSTGVTPELPIEDLAVYLPLEDSPQRWAQQVLDSAAAPRRHTTEEIVASGYDVRLAARILQDMYEEMVQ